MLVFHTAPPPQQKKNFLPNFLAILGDFGHFLLRMPAGVPGMVSELSSDMLLSYLPVNRKYTVGRQARPSLVMVTAWQA